MGRRPSVWWFVSLVPAVRLGRRRVRGNATRLGHMSCARHRHRQGDCERRGAGRSTLRQAAPWPSQAAPQRAPFNYPWHRYIVIDKSDSRLYFVEGGLVVRQHPVAVGAVRATTPNAIWRIGSKYFSDPRGVFGPRRMRMYRLVGGRFVYTRYLTHGINNPASIGTRASRGCIRMCNTDVLDLFPLVPLGTMVVTRD